MFGANLKRKVSPFPSPPIPSINFPRNSTGLEDLGQGPRGNSATTERGQVTEKN